MLAERVVVGVDFSEAAESAARWAATRLVPGAELVFVAVIEAGHTPLFMPPPLSMLLRDTEAARRHVGERLHALASELRPGRPRSLVRFGRAHEEIESVAAELRADLIVVGPHGDTRRTWGSLGSTAERLATSASVPVLVGASPKPHRLTSVLAAIDDAEITTTVIDWSARVSAELGARVTMVHALRDHTTAALVTVSGAPASSGRGMAPEADHEIVSSGVRWARERAEARFAGRHIDVVVAEGRADEVIVRAASDASADLIIMGRSGKGVIRRTFLGSTVGPVLHAAPCPVLVVVEPVP